jgi:pimeloyl-ACP methyl ester carboxylesterase
VRATRSLQASRLRYLALSRRAKCTNCAQGSLKCPCLSQYHFAIRRYEDTLQVIDNVALPGQHIIVGSSIGAWIALKAAAARRERIKARTLRSNSPLLHHASWVSHPGCATDTHAGAVYRCCPLTSLNARLPRLLQGLVLLAPAVDITELWWQALSAAEQADARSTGFVPLGGGTKASVLPLASTAPLPLFCESALSMRPQLWEVAVLP